MRALLCCYYQHSSKHHYLNHNIPPHHQLRQRQESRDNSMRGPNAGSGSTSKGGATAMAAFKQDLLRNLLLGLPARTAEAACPFDAMSLQERKRAVKCSADVAMAAARRGAADTTAAGRARWPKAILAAAAAAASGSRSPGGGTCKVRKSACCKRVARRRVDAKRIRARGYGVTASSAAATASCDAARRLVRRRTVALRKVIPGGNAAAMMDEAALLRETMDYVVHLRAQVDVLRRVSAAVQSSTFLRDPSQAMGES